MGDAGKGIVSLFGLIAALVALSFVLMFGVGACKDFNREQKRKDAENQVKITNIQVRNQQQRVKIAEQQAEIRLKVAIGIRKAQDEISNTLTPYYLQHEMIEALRASKAATVYIPTDPATGLPVVTTRNSAPGGK